MAKQRVVNTRFWDDDYVMDLEPNAKLLFLYCITNPLTDLCGAYETTLRRIAFDTGLKVAKIESLLDQFAKDGKILFRDGWLIIANFAKHQQGNSPKVALGVERSLKYCPDWVKDTLSKGIDTLSIGGRTLTLTCRDNLDLKGEPVLEPPLTHESKIQRADEWDAMDAYNLGYPLSEIYKFFPRLKLSPAQIGMLIAEIKDTPIDRSALQATMEQYVGNHNPATKSYLPEKVGNLLSVFKSKRAESEKGNGTNKTTYRQQRADEARLSAQRESEIRERVERRKAELSGSVVSDNPRLLSAVEPSAD